MRSGRTNQFFANRMAAAAHLIDIGAVSHIVASGDNRFENYNEPRDMAEVLTTLGVPESRITRDGHGLRTIDSVLRMREVHGHEQFIIVSQQFHVERALFIADAFGIDAIGYAADDVGGIANVSVRLREYAARVMALFDVYVRYRGGIEFAD
jgi:SanA protein